MPNPSPEPSLGRAPVTVACEQYRLANGLTVVLSADHSVPLVSVNVTYHVGSKDEVQGRTGFAHLFEHMLFQGSEHVGDEQHFAYIEQAGGSANGSTWFDKTNYYETLPARYLEMALWLESDRMGFLLPALTQEAFDGQRDVVKNERRWRVDNQPYGIWLERLLALSFPPQFCYHWPVIGFMPDLDAAMLEDVRGFYSQYYGPQNAVLTLVGDFDPDTARALVERYFGPLAAGPAKPRGAWTLPPLAATVRETCEDRVPAERVYLAYHAPRLDAPDAYAVDMLSDMLGSGRCSRLYRALVRQQRIAQDVFSWYLSGEAAGLFVLGATAMPGVTGAQLTAAIDAEVARLLAGGSDDAEMERAQMSTYARLVRDVETFEDRADHLAHFVTFFGEAAEINREAERYAAVDAAAIVTAARTVLEGKMRVELTFVPAAESASEEVA